ncbi:MAG: DNA polymerase domain-containing protein, partial [Thermoplasmatota archaeon]
MQVPLAAHRAIANDTQFIDIWSNGKLQRVRAPFAPYMYSKRKLAIDGARETRLDVRPLSTLAAEPWWKYEFPTVEGVPKASRGEQPLEMADNHVAYVERVLVDEPEFFRKFANTDPLRVMTLDIEQLTTGKGFPTDRDPLISIAWSCGDAEPEVAPLGDGKSDAELLAAFVKALRAYDPDVLVGYNIAGYDLPMVLKRLAANRMDTGALSRTGRPASADEEDVFVDGRLVYDVFESVKLDQTLFGIKDRRLKTVAEWLKLPNIVKEDTSDTRVLVGTPRLAEYNKSDVALTRALSRVYFRNYEALAEFYAAPLNVVLRATPVFHMTILQGRVFRQAEPIIVSDGTNAQRYATLYDAAGGQAFVGGIVDIYQRGLFEPVYKVDFSSMYPSIMVSLGAGADNTRMLAPSNYGDFKVEVDGELRRYSIPDDSRHVNLNVEIRGVSPMALELKRMLQLRLELKKKAKEAKDNAERDRLHATQNVMKVVLNAVYGVHASSFARYGSLPVAVATVGIARRLIRLVEGELGDGKIETDTDGVYAARAPDPEAINATVDAFMRTELGAENFTRIEVDEFRSGYFHERKAYLLLHKDGRIEKHGIAFKGSSLCGVFDKSLEKISRALLTKSGDARSVARECFDLTQYDQDDFIMRIRLGKEVADYKSGTPLGKQVAEAYMKFHGRTPARGEQLEYIKTVEKFDVPSDAAWKNLDKAYYLDIVR